ncbi:MAG: DNA repair protein RecO [Mycoplasmoidaceae bacterium]
MSETILEGYIIEIKDYQLFDNIITFFGNDNKIYNLLSLGSRKILSKNGRNMKVGALIEFEFFQARLIGNLSKLKKLNILNDVSWEIEKLDIINLLNQFLVKGYNNFKFITYQKIMNMILENRDINFISLFCLFEIIKSIGLRFELNGCAICNYNKVKTTSISFQGFLCEQCCRENNEYIYDTNVNKIFYFLNKKNYKEILKINEIDKLVAIAFMKTFIKVYH